MQTWQIQEAKARFSELVKQAQQDGPQELTAHGKPVAVLVSVETFERMTRSEGSLVEFMRHSPLYGDDEIEFERDTSLTRGLSL